MANLEKKSFDNPDELKTPEKTNAAVVNFGTVAASRVVLQPGWKWSECIKPAVKTDSCEKSHFGVCVSGKMLVTHDDGSSVEVGPGDAYAFAPGHDGEVISDEPFVGYEFNSATAATYAKE